MRPCVPLLAAQAQAQATDAWNAADLSGAALPLLGLGVYQNKTDCVDACLAALRLGYRHVDSAIAYKNEEDVGRVRPYLTDQLLLPSGLS